MAKEFHKFVTSNLILAAFGLLWIFPGLTESRRGTFNKNKCNKTVAIYEVVSSPPVRDKFIGQPVHCTYHLNPFPKERSEWAITLKFQKLKVGNLVNGTVCQGGYIEILDGSNSSSSGGSSWTRGGGLQSGTGGLGGKFCGEIEIPKEYISESDELWVIFHVDHYDEQSYFLFESRAEQQKDIYIRYGARSELFPNRRGQTIENTFCDKMFTDCKRESCYVQSPGFPGVYLRNLHCRYHLQAADAGFVRLDMTTSIDFMVDGQRCEDFMICPPKPFTANDCNFDYIKVYDGDSEESPVIGTFCGMGRVPFSIVGSTNRMLVEFVTAPNGSLLNTGFNFEVAPLIGSPLIGSWDMPGRKEELCTWEFTSEDLEKSGDSEGVFMSLAHWHKPGTRCTYKITGKEHEVVRMYFLSLRIGMTRAPIAQPMGQCTESLTIYDSDHAEPDKLIKMFCNSFSVGMEKVDFVSTGNTLFVEFESQVGSYEGSSIDFWAHYDFFNNTHYGRHVHGTLCDEVFRDSRESRVLSGVFGSPINTLVYTNGGTSEDGFITCKLHFQLDAALKKRIQLQLDSIKFGRNDVPCPPEDKDNPGHQLLSCIDSPRDKILIKDLTANLTIGCICDTVESTKPVKFFSSGKYVDLIFMVDQKHARSNYFRLNEPVFRGTYSYVHDSKCGPEKYLPTADGKLIYPQFADPQDIILLKDPSAESRVCVWEIQVSPERNLWLHIDELSLTLDNCDNEYLMVSLFGPTSLEPHAFFCKHHTHKDMSVINAEEFKYGRAVRIVFKTQLNSKSTFSLSWTELYPYNYGLGLGKNGQQ